MRLSSLREKVRYRLGTQVQTRYTDGVLNEAINTARRVMLMEYDLELFKKESNVSFVSGTGSKPADYFRNIKYPKRCLYNATTDEDYERVDWDEFDDEVEYTWTEKNASLYIYPADTVTLKMRYFYEPLDMTEVSDDDGLSSMMSEALVWWSAHLILFNDRQFETASYFKQEAKQIIDSAAGRQVADVGRITRNDFENPMQDVDDNLMRQNIIL